MEEVGGAQLGSVMRLQMSDPHSGIQPASIYQVTPASIYEIAESHRTVSK